MYYARDVLKVPRQPRQLGRPLRRHFLREPLLRHPIRPVEQVLDLEVSRIPLVQ